LNFRLLLREQGDERRRKFGGDNSLLKLRILNNVEVLHDNLSKDDNHGQER
jgi:hypothetical protein